ncbi:hypothetical protein ACWEOO_16410 [Kribbella sp. NPDC004138]
MKVDGVRLPSAALDYEWHVLDHDDEVHRLDPRRPALALCGQRWVEPWWEADWSPDNYPRCSGCRRIRCALDYEWFVLAHDDVVHQLNSNKPGHALCGTPLTAPWWEDDWRPANYPSCDACTSKARRLKSDDDEARTPALYASRRVVRRLQNAKPITPVVQKKAKRPKELTTAQRWRMAVEADRQSSRSQRSVSIRTVSGGLPSLGRRR